jgi:hypothetical protein
VWKGYREAQCGWMLVHDSTTGEGGVGYGMYVVILAPSRSQVEVWRAPLGPRVMVVPLDDPSRTRLVSTCSAGVVQGADCAITSDCCLLQSSESGGAGFRVVRVIFVARCLMTCLSRRYRDEDTTGQ